VLEKLIKASSRGTIERIPDFRRNRLEQNQNLPYHHRIDLGVVLGDGGAVSVPLSMRAFESTTCRARSRLR